MQSITNNSLLVQFNLSLKKDHLIKLFYSLCLKSFKVFCFKGKRFSSYGFNRIQKLVKYQKYIIFEISSKMMELEYLNHLISK
jgi:hypothetical protein